jgi:transcriptional regulator with XRE-family HTH domain
MERDVSHPIRTIRLRRKLTQQELADALGVTKGAVCQWERGRTIPNPRMAVALMKKLPGLSLKAIYRRVSPAA